MALCFLGSGSEYLSDTFEPIYDRLETVLDEEDELRMSTDSMNEYQTLDEVGFRVTDNGALILLSESKREKVEAVWLKTKLPSGTKVSEPAEGECGICMTGFGDKIFETPCGHKYCEECIAYYFHLEAGDVQRLNHVRSYLEVDPVTSHSYLRINQVCGVICPHPTCNTAIDGFLFRDIVTPQTWARFDSVSLSASLHYLQLRGDVRPCPKKCGGFIQACNTCSNLKCQQKTQLEVERRETALLRMWTREHEVRRCPHCQILIEKNGGCDHMYCISCKKRYNWSGSRLTLRK